MIGSRTLRDVHFIFGAWVTFTVLLGFVVEIAGAIWLGAHLLGPVIAAVAGP